MHKIGIFCLFVEEMQHLASNFWQHFRKKWATSSKCEKRGNYDGDYKFFPKTLCGPRQN